MLQRASANLGGGGSRRGEASQPARTQEVVEALCRGDAPPWAFGECFEAPAGRGSRTANFAASLTSGPRARLERALKRIVEAGAVLDDVRVADGLCMALTDEIEVLIFRTITLEERIAGLEDDNSFAAAERFRSSLRRPQARRQLFETYPGLLRQLHLRSDRWFASCIEMIDRLQADRQALAGTFGIDTRDRLASATIAHGEAHLGGRRVILLRFGSGARLIYKPRPLEAAQRFQALLAFLNREGIKSQLRTLDVLPCGDYGWIEHVSGRSCRTDTGVTRYFRRAGALIAALHVTGATDCHFENVLADGEHPLVVDLETLMRPQVRSVDAATDLAIHTAEDSVLAIGILPSLDGSELGALAVQPGQITQLTTIGLIDAGTPNARVEKICWRLGDVPSLPLRRRERVDAADYAGDIESGFTDAYELILKHRDMLLAPGGIIPDLGRAKVRLVLRQTSFYADILSDSIHPARSTMPLRRIACAHVSGAARSTRSELLR